MKKYAVSIPFRYWETIEVEAESKEEALEKVTGRSFVGDIVTRTDISCADLEWDYSWLDTCTDRTDDIVEDVSDENSKGDKA